MRTKKLASLLAVLLTVATLLSVLPTYKASAATADEVQYFLDTVGPMCTNDMRDNKILASFSLAQAIWESGWGTSTLAKEANALFGIRAYSGWDGMVYDRNEKVLYKNWAAVKAAKGDAYVKANTLAFWRGYTSWQESVSDHSSLFNNMSIYANLRENYDYKSCCKLVVEDGYCTDSAYTSCLISIIEQYELDQYNYGFDATDEEPDTSTDTEEEVQIELKPAKLYMEKGATYTLDMITGKNYTLKSSNTSVASLRGNVVTAVADGTAKITLKSNDQSLTCTVTVKSGYGCIVTDGVYVKCLASGTATIPAEAKTVSAGAFKGVNVNTVIVGNSVSKIEDGAFNGISGGITLCGYGNSTAESFANKNSISYVNLAGWSVDRSTAILSGIQTYTTAAVVDSYYSLSGVSATVEGANGTALKNTAYVGTGCKVTVSGSTYTVEIKGDTSGDGKISTADLVTLKVYLAGTDNALPDRVYRRAADFNGDNRITTADYLAIAQNA